MSSLFILIPLGLGLLAIAIAIFIWAANDGQFDDLDTPAVRILLDGDESAPENPERRP